MSKTARPRNRKRRVTSKQLQYLGERQDFYHPHVYSDRDKPAGTEPTAPLILPPCTEVPCVCPRGNRVLAQAPPDASVFLDLIVDTPEGAAYRDREQQRLDKEPRLPVVLIGIDPPLDKDTPHRRQEPTLDEIAALPCLIARSHAICMNQEHRSCAAWRALVKSVKDSFPMGPFLQCLLQLQPKPEPGPKFYPSWYRPRRPYGKSTPLLKAEAKGGLFAAFGVDLPPEDPLTQETKEEYLRGLSSEDRKLMEQRFEWIDRHHTKEKPNPGFGDSLAQATQQDAAAPKAEDATSYRIIRSNNEK